MGALQEGHMAIVELLLAHRGKKTRIKVEKPLGHGQKR
jgi:hypothetical protein